MNFHAYYFPEKVHLSGADCFHLVLDRHAKKHEAGGNVMRKIFFFEHTPALEKVETVFKQSPLIHWLCNISLVSGSLLRIPYWKYENVGREIFINEHHHSIDRNIPPQVLTADIPIDADR